MEVVTLAAAVVVATAAVAVRMVAAVMVVVVATAATVAAWVGASEFGGADAAVAAVAQPVTGVG